MTATAPILRELEADDMATLQAIPRAAFEPVFNSFRALVGEEIEALALRIQQIWQTRPALSHPVDQPPPEQRMAVK